MYTSRMVDDLLARWVDDVTQCVWFTLPVRLNLKNSLFLFHHSKDGIMVSTDDRVMRGGQEDKVPAHEGRR